MADPQATERPIPRWVMREALCLSFYGTAWADTSAFRRGICDDMARDALNALDEAGFGLSIRGAGPAHFDMSKAEGDGT